MYGIYNFFYIFYFIKVVSLRDRITLDVMFLGIIRKIIHALIVILLSLRAHCYIC